MNVPQAQPGRHLPSATARIAIAMLLGGFIGAVFGPRVAFLGEAGKTVISLIKMLAPPLILFAILDAFLRTRINRRSAVLIVMVSAINAAFAMVIGLTLANAFQPGRYLTVPTGVAIEHQPPPPAHKVNFFDDLLALLPTNLIEPFRTNAVVSVVILAVLTGAALRRYKDERLASGSTDYLAIEQLISGGLRSLETMIGWFVALLPIAVFAVMAQTVGTQGLSAIRGLAVYVVVVIVGLLTQVLVVYQSWIVLVARVPLRIFWSTVRTPLACAAGCGSSLATLPVTLKSLEGAGVSDRSARLSACVATNLNNDGILLYEAMAAIIVAQASGISLTLGDQLAIGATCVLASVGIAGVPEAGLISLAIVLASAKLPLDLLPLLLSVDWIIGRCRAMTNVIGDILGAFVLDRLDSGPAAVIIVPAESPA
jgi:Na+/H+-dicarboxylate symporter